jgi:murein DD-endopeptidase MepM/ murein hydrolase activator NlpD
MNNSSQNYNILEMEEMIESQLKAASPNFSRTIGILVLTALSFFFPALAAEAQHAREPIVRAVDLNIGETANVKLSDGSIAQVKLLELDEETDPLRGAIRTAAVTVEVNGKTVQLISANYNLPQTVGGVQIDCPITKGYRANSRRDMWALEKDARLRLWPAESPLIDPQTFTYPVKQRWFATYTQMSNEPTYVDGGEQAGRKDIYYHNDLDFGGCEGMVDVVAATDGLVVSSGESTMSGYEDSPANQRYDVVYLLDDRGWYYRYSHLFSIDEAIKPGVRVEMGQKIGVLGKEGGSGGWSHLHFGIVSRQPSGNWGTQEAYAFVWETYIREHKPKLIAVARPHHFKATGEKVILDGAKSWSSAGRIVAYNWTFTDGTKATGPQVERSYNKPGMYTETLRVEDAQGNVDYDFAVVQVIDPTRPDEHPPSIHPAYSPTTGIHPGDKVTFKVRTFRTTDGEEVWDFGDGTKPVTVKSDGNVKKLAKNGYAVTEHSFQKPGTYLVRVQRTNKRGETAVGRLAVHVE